MIYPVPIVIDKTVRDVEKFLDTISAERNMTPSLIELVLYKVISDVQKDKLAEYAENCISLQNELDLCKKTEEKDG